MIEWAMASDGPTVGLLVDHDDADREFRYESVAGTFEADENIVDVARREGWVVASMLNDWSTVFPA
jgi:transposase-like protein